jgi:hypothetical protein
MADRFDNSSRSTKAGVVLTVTTCGIHDTGQPPAAPDAAAPLVRCFPARLSRTVERLLSIAANFC